MPSLEMTSATAFAAGSERRDLAAAYEAGLRHTRRVRFLRRALPAAVILSLVAVVFGAWFDPLRLLREFPIEFARMAISGNKLKIEAPKLSGFTREGRAYSVTAESAAQDLTQPGVIELTGIEARFDLAGGGTTTLTASKGILDAKAERLRLVDGIDIVSSNGFGGKLVEAFVEMRRGHVLSPKPVDLRYQDGWLKADRLEIFDNGARALFEGNITAQFRLNSPPAPPAAPAAELKR